MLNKAADRDFADTGEVVDMSSPLKTLSYILSDDMDAVNALILKRLHSSVPLIPQIASYLISAGGKRIRPLLTLASASIFNANMNRAHVLASAVEFIHTATLLHDDVVDESLERRGQDAASQVFGNQASVLVGDFLFSRSFQLMVETGSIDVLRILSDASAIIAEGEVLQLSMAGNIDLTMDQYIQIITSKTAALFSAACEVGPVCANAGETDISSMAVYGLNLGIAFQIADDALDYMAARDKLGKTIGDDFREGKITAPILFALRHAKTHNLQHDLDFWNRVITDQTQKDGDLQHAQKLFKGCGAIQSSLELAQSYGDKAICALERVPDHEIKSLFVDLVDYSIHRPT